MYHSRMIPDMNGINKRTTGADTHIGMNFPKMLCLCIVLYEMRLRQTYDCELVATKMLYALGCM